VTRKDQGHDPIIFEAPYHHNGARQTGRQFPIMTSTPVIISIILDWSQIDTESLTQAEKERKST